jgi:hypothetical protein
MEIILQHIFQENLLNPTECHGLRLSNKEYGDILEKNKGPRHFMNIHDMVHKKGLYLHSFESFQFALSLGYLYSNFTLEALDKFGGSNEIREFLLNNGCYYPPKEREKKKYHHTIFVQRHELKCK